MFTIAKDNFPIKTKVVASVTKGGASAGTIGEVMGHLPNGNVGVRFKEGTAAFELALLTVAPLPGGWNAGQACAIVVDSPGKVASGEAGKVLG